MSAKCLTCSKTVYQNDPKVVVGEDQFHKGCFVCSAGCGTRLELKTYKSHKNSIFCSKCVPVEKPNYGHGSMESERTKTAETLKKAVAIQGSSDRLKGQGNYTYVADGVEYARVKGNEETKRQTGHIVTGENRLKRSDSSNKYTYSTDGMEYSRVKGNEETKRTVSGEDRLKFAGEGNSNYTYTADSIDYTRVKGNEEIKRTVSGEDRLKFVGDNSYSYDPESIEYKRVKDMESIKKDTFHSVTGEDRLKGDNSYITDPEAMEYQRVKRNEENKNKFYSAEDRLRTNAVTSEE